VRGGGRDDRRDRRRRGGAAGRRDVDAALPARDRRRPAGGRLRLFALVLCAALLAAGCGAEAPDLFSVTRSGADRAANVTVIVSDAGSVTCNGASHALDAKLLLRARQLARDLGQQAELGLELPPGAGSTLHYKASLETGHVAFSDRSAGQPKDFFQLAQFTKDVSEDVCGIQR
jgi:hypothetical protein